ncbi:alginate export family protein [Croceibacterium sp. TMG7-5b_MA50]|uniref:alginate export family protein n=1 Tax=Croceibacterium sp. TMG7-5b_MA50 TaxID=3121290 RepID=UPI0032215EC0
MGRRHLLGMGVLLLASPAAAQEITPLLDARLRYEHAEQADLPDESDALVMRLRAGATVTSGRFALLAEGQALFAPIDRYNDGLHGPATRPIVADPENWALYRAQVQYRSDPLVLTAGRQRIALDDERFVGNVAFRANAQTFDAIRAEIAPTTGVKADLTYAWSVRTIWGFEGAGARPQAAGGDKIFANLSWASPVGKVTGFAYLLEQDSTALIRQSSQSYGLRLTGAQPVSAGWSVAYQASHARQADWRGNPNDYRARYWLADLVMEGHGWRLGGGYELLGAADGRALTSFQTPLGTNFKFQGWADRFLTTPPDGVADWYVQGQRTFKAVGPADALSLQAAWHWYRSDRQQRPYGRELNLLASASFGKTALSARYAHYEAQSFASDSDRLWLQIDWSL